jgi:hypothetical protein
LQDVCCYFLDGPYNTLLASVKLEGALRRISQGLPFPQDQDTTAEQHRLSRQEKWQHTQQQQQQQQQLVRGASDVDGNNGSSKPSAPFELIPHQRRKQQQQQQQQQQQKNYKQKECSARAWPDSCACAGAAAS